MKLGTEKAIDLLFDLGKFIIAGAVVGEAFAGSDGSNNMFYALGTAALFFALGFFVIWISSKRSNK